MSLLTIELDEERERMLQEIVSQEHKSPQDICLEAIDALIQRRGRLHRLPPSDPYAPLREMIGLVKEGPADASVRHDVRPEDDH